MLTSLVFTKRRQILVIAVSTEANMKDKDKAREILNIWLPHGECISYIVDGRILLMIAIIIMINTTEKKPK